MSKSMYSLILSDEIIDRIDMLAKLQNQSRSSLINQILASYVSVTTPEQRMSNLCSLMLESMERFSSEFRLSAGERSRDFTAVAALKYKYNPTIRYNVALYTDDAEHIGELRATLRTQNARLLQEYAGFIMLWRQTEAQFSNSVCELKGGVYRRLIARPHEAVSADSLSRSITDYITLFNSCVKLYLSGEKTIAQTADAIMRRYSDYRKGGFCI